jgi:hypothetical protein
MVSSFLSAALPVVGSCFDARAWQEAHRATAGFHLFSQGYQDSALLSLSKHGLINVSATYVEFGFHVKDVAGTQRLPPHHKGTTRHLTPHELPAFGSNTEMLRSRHGWSGVRFDADEESLDAIPDLRIEWMTPQTVVSVFRRHGVKNSVDYVSIDIDSCDLWVFLALTDVYRPRLLTIEYNPAFPFNESKTNVCVRPQDGALYSTGLYRTHSLDGASLLALARAARRRGYEVIWVEPYLDVFVARADLLCPGSVPPLRTFRSSAGTSFHHKAPPGATEKWFATYE